jgi:hypothetical protein
MRWQTYNLYTAHLVDLELDASICGLTGHGLWRDPHPDLRICRKCQHYAEIRDRNRKLAESQAE